jgi:hypothetical protein
MRTFAKYRVFQNYRQKMLHSKFPHHHQREIAIKRFFMRLYDFYRFKFVSYNLLNFDIANSKVS